MARLCLALLRNSNCCLEVVQEAVRNFDVESYHRGNPRGFPFFCLWACVTYCSATWVFVVRILTNKPNFYNLPKLLKNASIISFFQ